MEYTKLGRSGLLVSRLSLGTMNFGNVTDEKESFAIMDRALDAGINFFDTANVYGGAGGHGRTEEIIGRWFAQGGGRRERVVLATKVYGDMENEVDGPNGPRGLSAYKIRRHLEASLRRLQTDHVELYQMHHVDRTVGWEELWGAFEAAVNSGKIDYIGSSNFAARDLVKAQYEAKARHFLGLVSEQHKYNLLCRLPELEVLPAALEHGIGVIPWSPLAGGLLGGHAFEQRSGARANADRLDDATRKQLQDFSKAAHEAGLPEADLALAWTLHHPAVTAPIIGPRNVGQLDDALRVVGLDLQDDLLSRLDEIFPGPGGEAPQAYAW